MNRLSALPRAILGRPISACRATRFLATVARPARLGAGVPRAPMVGLTTPSTPAIGARFRTTDASETADGPFAVVSLMGKDRKGIVRDFSSLLSKMGANVEESRMSRLGGTFAVIVLVSLKGNRFEAFQKQVAEAFPDFQIHTTLTESSTPVVHDPSVASYEIVVDGPDSVGIVSAITGAISKVGNITNIETEVHDAPFAGFKMFSMIARADLTKEWVPKLQEELASIEEGFGLEIDIYEEEIKPPAEDI